MKTPDLDRFDALLLDMHGTFMFGHDRLGQDEDFHRTYRSLGGRRLRRDALQRAVRACCRDMSRRYADAAQRDRFPSVLGTLRSLPLTAGLPAAEITRIADVIGCHERGDVAPDYVTLLKALAARHRVGVVSNIWADKRHWLERFEARGILALFEVLVFSSDGPHVKPAPALFRRALDQLGLPAGRVLFVGDDPLRDIAGAAALGMSTLLVGDKRSPGIEADWTLPSLLALAPGC